MTENIGKTPEKWRNYNTKSPIAAARLRRGDVKRLYKLINDKQIEYRDRLMPILQKQDNETSDDFDERRKRVYDSFVTSMTMQTEDGAMLHGNDEKFLEEDNLPDRIRSIFFSTGNVPKAVTGFEPSCRIVLFLDFSTPPLLDFTKLPSLPTPNESNFEIFADNHSWFAASNAVLKDFFVARRTSNNLLHSAAIYDVLLFLIGLPISIWTIYRLSSVLSPASTIPWIVSTAAYIYAFFFSLIIFRIFFSYSRWVFPKIELESLSSSHLRHRSAWAAIALPLALAFIYDVGKSILSN